MIRMIAVVGPTCVGKTKFAIDIANSFNGEIVSCDSIQLYKYMDIGSAKPSKEELSMARHHLVDIIDPREKMSSYKYQMLAKEAIKDIDTRGKTPVISGGTGLYLNSLIYDMDFAAPPEDPELRDKYQKIAFEQGPEVLYDELKEIAPESAEKIHPNNIKRVIRALEAAVSGAPVQDISKDLTKNEEYDIILIGLTRDRQELYDRIDRRVEVLIEEGLFDEVKKLVDMGLTYDDISMKGIGYKELIAHMNGEYDFDEAVRLIKRNTRHYAKRQMTWFKRYEDMEWFNISEYSDDEAALEDIKAWLRKRS